MSNAIAIVKYLGPTNTLGARFRVTRIGWSGEGTQADVNRSKVVSYSHAASNASVQAVIDSGLFELYDIQPAPEDIAYSGETEEHTFFIVSHV